MAATTATRNKAAKLRGTGMSQMDAAAEVGVGQTTISRWERTHAGFRLTLAKSKAQAWAYCDELVKVTGQRLLERAPEEEDLGKLGALFSHAVKHVVSIEEQDVAEERKQYASEEEALRDLAARLTPEQLAKLNEMSAG